MGCQGGRGPTQEAARPLCEILHRDHCQAASRGRLSLTSASGSAGQRANENVRTPRKFWPPPPAVSSTCHPNSHPYSHIRAPPTRHIYAVRMRAHMAAGKARLPPTCSVYGAMGGGSHLSRSHVGSQRLLHSLCAEGEPPRVIGRTDRADNTGSDAGLAPHATGCHGSTTLRELRLADRCRTVRHALRVHALAVDVDGRNDIVAAAPTPVPVRSADDETVSSRRCNLHSRTQVAGLSCPATGGYLPTSCIISSIR